MFGPKLQYIDRLEKQISELAKRVARLENYRAADKDGQNWLHDLIDQVAKDVGGFKRCTEDFRTRIRAEVVRDRKENMLADEDLRDILDALLDHLGIDLEYVEPETKGKYRVIKRNDQPSD